MAVPVVVEVAVVVVDVAVEVVELIVVVVVANTQPTVQQSPNMLQC